MFVLFSMVGELDIIIRVMKIQAMTPRAPWMEERRSVHRVITAHLMMT